MISITTIIISAACFLIGAGLGHLYSRKNQPSDRSTQDLEKKLAKTEQQLRRYQQEVTEHFLKVSHLTTNMTQSYRKIHEHLATSAIRLASPEIGRQLLKASGTELNLTDEDGNPLLSTEDIQPPRDYAPKVPGGVLSEDYGLNDEGAVDGEDNEDDGTLEDDGDPTQKI